MNVDKDTQKQIDALRRFIDAHSDIKVLLEHSAEWADTQAEQTEKSKRTAWRVAGAAGGCAVLALAVALTAIATSYRPAPPPEILRVNSSTGTVDRLISLKEFQETADEAAIKRSITAFMRARENYTFDTAEQNYYDAAAFMSPQLQAQWAAYWDASNPRSPLNYYKRDTKVRIEIGAISINRDSNGKANSARVSFARSIKRNEILVSPESAWITTISFGFVNVPVQERARRVNDLGFQVTDYQVDADIASNGSATSLDAPARPAAGQSVQSTPQALSAPQTVPGGVQQ